MYSFVNGEVQEIAKDMEFWYKGKYIWVVSYGNIRNWMLNVDCSGNYYVGIDLNGNRNIIK